MILKALYDYYNRCGDLAPEGMEYKELAFLVVIDKEGNFVRLEDRRIDKKNCEKFLVAKAVGRSSNPVANILWDNCSYVLGLPGTEKDVKNHKVFIAKINEIAGILPNNYNVIAVNKFYEKENKNIEDLKRDSLWSELDKNLIKNISFKLDGDNQCVAAKHEIIDVLIKMDECETNSDNICLVTGDYGPSVETTTATSIPGSQAVAKLVAFQVNSGYDSYGKSKGFNAPISKKAEFAYTTALNKLLAKDSKNKFYIGSRTFLFWASSNDEASVDAEESFFALFNSPKEETDDPNRRIVSVKKVFNDIYSGIRPTSDDDRFYFLGLAPNAARIAVVYWHECKLKDFAGTILRHFKDTDIVDTRKEKKPYQGLYQLLSAVTLGGKSSDAQPNLPEAVIKSIMQGLPYPATLFQACIRRVRAEQQLKITRAAIIKAYLNRLNDNNKKLEIMLDKENTNVGYLCGRLFATLEKIQEDANHIHTIRERYLNSASATPAAVFATIMNLSVHHSEKLNAGHQIFFEKVKQEIISKLPADGFPPHLELQDQGRFFVGYYHQRQDFFTSKEANDAGVNEETQNEE